jgi:hypothetical protein
MRTLGKVGELSENQTIAERMMKSGGVWDENDLTTVHSGRTVASRQVLSMVSSVMLWRWLLQVMFPSVCNFIVFWFSLSFTTYFGLHGHLQVWIFDIFILICLKDSASLLFWYVALLSCMHACRQSVTT